MHRCIESVCENASEIVDFYNCIAFPLNTSPGFVGAIEEQYKKHRDHTK